MAETDWTAEETASLDRLPKYSGRDYDANDPVDQYAFGEGGYLVNQMRQANDVGIIGRAVRRMAVFVKGLSDLTADDRRQTGEDRAATSQSAQNAATSETNAAKAFDDFDDRYLGAKASDPAKDNDGNNLIVGALYFSMALGSMRVWNGNAWQAQVPAAADFVQKTRQVTASTGLTGGGDLSADRSLAADFASQSEATSGMASGKVMSPLRVAQAIAALAPTPPAPGLVFISAQTVSAAVASVDFTGLSNAFDEYVIHFQNVVPSVDSSQLGLRTSADNGATFASGSSDYGYGFREDAPGSSGASGGTTTTASARICGSQYGINNSAALGGATGETIVVRPASSSEIKQIKSSFIYAASGFGGNTQAVGQTGANRNSSAAINAIRFHFASGNIASGTFKLYGRRKV